MDQTKIGKLIAKLRKEKGMTQRELGDKVGVGFKAVSKWERGITCPDISIINELSKILGITSDELLTGELSKEHTVNNNKTKFNKKILLIIPILIFIAILTFIISKINKNHIEAYNLDSASEEYYVDGSLIFKNQEITIYINKLEFIDKEFNKIRIKNYEYSLIIDDINIASYGYTTEMNSLSSNISIKDFSNSFNAFHSNSINNENKKQTIKNGLILKITFLDINDNSIEKSISMSLSKYKK